MIQIFLFNDVIKYDVNISFVFKLFIVSLKLVYKNCVLVQGCWYVWVQMFIVVENIQLIVLLLMICSNIL